MPMKAAVIRRRSEEQVVQQTSIKIYNNLCKCDQVAWGIILKTFQTLLIILWILIILMVGHKVDSGLANTMM